MTGFRAVALCLLALMVTAGCSGPLFGTDGTGRDPYGVPETTVPETTTVRTTTATATTATTATTTTAATTLTPAASPAFRAAVTNHSLSLRTVGQFVVRERIRRSGSVGGGNATSTVNLTFAADLYADRYWFGLRNVSEGGVYDSGLAYQDGTAVYHREELPNGTVVYRRIPDDRERSVTPRQWALQWLRTVRNASVMYPFERNGTVTLAGETMVRFTASGLPPFGCGSGARGPGDLRNVTAARAVALVDDLGLVRRFECVMAGRLYTGDRYRERVTWTLAEVGTATLRPPDRLVDATDPRNGSLEVESPGSGSSTSSHSRYRGPAIRGIDGPSSHPPFDPSSTRSHSWRTNPSWGVSDTSRHSSGSHSG